MDKIYTGILFFTMSSLFNAQQLNKESITGFWKLKEAGFYENKKKVIKDFDNCRLMRNYSIRDDGFAIYNYMEGNSGNCMPSEPRLSFWRIVGDRLQFYVGNQILEEVIVAFNQDKTVTFTTYRAGYTKLDGDALSEKIMNTTHYDILEKQD